MRLRHLARDISNWEHRNQNLLKKLNFTNIALKKLADAVEIWIKF